MTVVRLCRLIAFDGGSTELEQTCLCPTLAALSGTENASRARDPRDAQVINECRRRKLQLEHYSPDVRTIEVEKAVDYSRYIGGAAFLELVRNLDGVSLDGLEHRRHAHSGIHTAPLHSVNRSDENRSCTRHPSRRANARGARSDAPLHCVDRRACAASVRTCSRCCGAGGIPLLCRSMCALLQVHGVRIVI